MKYWVPVELTPSLAKVSLCAQVGRAFVTRSSMHEVERMRFPQEDMCYIIVYIYTLLQ